MNIEDNYFENSTIILKIDQKTSLLLQTYLTNTNIAKRIKLLIRSNSKKQIITEFDYLNISDIAKILIFIFSFPWVILYKSNLKSHTYE